MALNRKVKTLKNKIKNDEMKISELSTVIKENEALIKGLKAQHEKLEECEEEVEAWKRQAENLTSIMEKEKREHEKDILVLKTKMKETLIISEKEIKSLKLEIEAGNTNMKQVTNKHKHVFDQLKDKVECPVCLEIPRSGPVYVCPNGHAVCKNCKTGSCPSCRVAMGNGKSLLALTVIENIDHRCKFVECEDFFPSDKLEDHEKICKHRIVSCPYDLCNEKVALSKLMDHLNRESCSSDSVPTVITNCYKSGRANFCANADLAESELTWIVHTFLYQDVSFAVFPKKFDNLYHFVMIMFATKKECFKYKIEMEVHERDSKSSQDSEVSFRYSGKPCSIEEDKKEQKYFGLTVNNRGMESILKKSQTNAFSLSFTLSKLKDVNT